MTSGVVKVPKLYDGVKIDNTLIGTDVMRQRVEVYSGETLPVSGTVAVSGNVEITNDVGNPLPVNGTVEITNDVGNAIPVSGTVAATQSGAWVDNITKVAGTTISYATGIPVYFGNTTQQDAFSRLRASTPQVLGYGSSEYGLNPNFLESKTVGTGSVANVLTDPSITLSTGGTASGAKATVQTLVFHRYTPGRSQLVRWTTDFAPQKTNVRQRAGYFSNTDGLFVENDGTGWFFVRRYGSSDVQRVPRASWDDPLDGTGPSGVSIDFAKTVLWFVDMEWLGVGRFRFGCASPTTGALVVAYANSGINLGLLTPYMKTACLPVRYEIENTGVAASATALQMICYSVDTEGGDEGRLPVQTGADNGATAITLNNGTTGGAYKPILSIRAATTGPNSVVNRGQMILTDYNVMVTGNSPINIRLFLNATINPTVWTTRGALGEFNVDATTISGGTRILSDYAMNGSGVKTSGTPAAGESFRKVPIVYTELNSLQTTLTIAAVGVGGTSAAIAAVNWQELY